MCISIFIDLGANSILATFGQGEGEWEGGICLFYSHRTMHLSPSPVRPFGLAHAGAGLASLLAVLILCTGLSTGCTDLL